MLRGLQRSLTWRMGRDRVDAWFLRRNHNRDVNRFVHSYIVLLWVMLSVRLVAADARTLHMLSLSSLATADDTHRSRVIAIQDNWATAAFEPRPQRVQTMVERGIRQLSGATNTADAWRTYVSTQDVVGLKVYSAPGSIIGTRPVVVAEVIQGLLNAGLAASNIVVWDKRLSDLRHAGFGTLENRFGIQLAGAQDEGYDEGTFYEAPLLGHLIWGDHEFGTTNKVAGRKSFVTKLLTQRLTKIITISPLLKHYEAGVTGALYSLGFGALDNTARFEAEASRMADPLPEIIAMPAVGDKAVLHITDALLCQYEGDNNAFLRYSTPLNELWFSTDPVALDELGIKEVQRQRRLAGLSPLKASLDIYHNAALLQLGNSEERLILMELITL